jgi:hypothetical protein
MVWLRTTVLGRLGWKPSPHPRAHALSCPPSAFYGPGTNCPARGTLARLDRGYAKSCIRTSMRRHCLSSRRGGYCWWPRRNCFLPFARYASIRTLGEPLFGSSVHTMRSVFSSQRRCNLPSGLSSLRMDQVRMAQSPYARSEALSRARTAPWPSATSGRLAAVPVTSPPPRSFAPSLLFKQPPPALLGADACGGADRRALL